MRSILTAAVAMLAFPLAAQSIRFVPPDPTSRTPVTAYVSGARCGAVTAAATRTNLEITITVREQVCGFPMILGYDIPVDLGVLPAGIYDVTARHEAFVEPQGRAQLPVAEAVPPFVVRPNVSHLAGEIVRIAGTNIVSCPQGCEDVVVRFDGVAGEVISTSSDEVIVRAPAHSAGTVDVELQTTRGTLRSIAAFHYYQTSALADPAFFERVLFPVLYSGPGSFGSQWTTDLVIHNGNAFEMEGETLPIVCGACTTRLVPGEDVVIHGRDLATGFVSYLPRQAMKGAAFGLLVRDLSRDASAFGASVPIVRESEWFDRPFSIVNVPSDPRYRVALRLYGSRLVYEVRMNIVALQTNSVLVYAIEYPKPSVDHSFAFIGDLLVKYPEIAGKGPLRIEVQSATPLYPLWAYVTITNNETQNVTVIAPE